MKQTENAISLFISRFQKLVPFLATHNRQDRHFLKNFSIKTIITKPFDD